MISYYAELRSAYYIAPRLRRVALGLLHCAELRSAYYTYAAGADSDFFAWIALSTYASLR